MKIKQRLILLLILVWLSTAAFAQQTMPPFAWAANADFFLVGDAYLRGLGFLGAKAEFTLDRDIGGVQVRTGLQMLSNGEIRRLGVPLDLRVGLHTSKVGLWGGGGVLLTKDVLIGNNKRIPFLSLGLRFMNLHRGDLFVDLNAALLYVAEYDFYNNSYNYTGRAPNPGVGIAIGWFLPYGQKPRQ